ncbi:hypothetical protein PGB90_010364 [Kerria lacca]
MLVLMYLLIICANRYTVSCQYTGCEYENTGENDPQRRESAIPVTGLNSCSFWTRFIDSINLRKITTNAFDIWQKIWNSGLTLKFNVSKNDENDTLVNVRFDNRTRMENENEVGRTFGLRRRMQLLLFLPISFKLGVIVTLLLVLTTMSLKTLIIGFIILLLLLHHTNSYSKLWGASKVSELPDFHKNVHIHVHTLPEDHHPYVESWHGSPSQANLYHA